jgi:ATP/maltotriose-dependent transcriptional regulator MalT
MTSFEEGVAVAGHAVMRAHCLARLYASMTRSRRLGDDTEAADHYLVLGLAMGERHGNCATCHALLLPAAVSVRVAQGDLAAAAAFCDQLDESAEKYASRTWIAMARQARGELAAAQGRLDDALVYYAEAQAGFAAAGNEYEVARCLSAAAELRLARRAPGDVELARAAQAEADHIQEQLVVG